MNKLDNFYMNIALLTSYNSKAKRNKVGAILVKDSNIISFGWNGTPHGFDNNCEDKDGNTIPEVIHSEVNCIAKIAKNGSSSDGATMYITLSPCFDCAKLLIASGIKRLVYLEEYRILDSLEMLKKANIIVEKLTSFQKIL